MRPSRKGWRKEGLGIGLAVVGLCLHLAPVGAILGVEDLKPGMKGIGKTVFHGTTVENFDFEIIDVLYTEGFATDLILIKVGGEPIERIGGICAGMSGSPLFIGDHMIGAIAFTTPMADTHYGYATPIKDMLKVLEMAGEEKSRPNSPSEKLAGPAPAESSPEEAEPKEGEPATSYQDEPQPGEPQEAGMKTSRRPSLLELLPAQTPVMVGGLRGRPFEMLARRLRAWNLRPVQSSTALVTEAVEPDPLKPGSAIGLSLVTGDVTVTALGTLTYRYGDRILAFGHPFMQRGETSLFLSPAYIYEVVKSLDMPFKIGAPLGEPVGAITQDRVAGVAGRLRREADYFTLQARVEDRDLGRSRRVTVRVVRDDLLAPGLIAVALLQVLDDTLDRLGGGTVEATWVLSGAGLDRPVKRNDLFFSEEDIAAETVTGLLGATDRLLRNEFQEVRLEEVDVRLEAQRQPRTARLLEATVTPSRAKPGDTLQLQVQWQPYRGQPETKELSLTIPADFEEDVAVIAIHGRENRATLGMNGEIVVATGDPMRPARDWPALLKQLEQENKGNTLVAELVTEEGDKGVGREGPLARPEGDTEPISAEASLPSPPGTERPPATVVQAQLETDYVVLGRLKKRVKILRD